MFLPNDKIDYYSESLDPTINEMVQKFTAGKSLVQQKAMYELVNKCHVNNAFSLDKFHELKDQQAILLSKHNHEYMKLETEIRDKEKVIKTAQKDVKMLNAKKAVSYKRCEQLSEIVRMANAIEVGILQHQDKEEDQKLEEARPEEEQKQDANASDNIEPADQQEQISVDQIMADADTGNGEPASASTSQDQTMVKQEDSVKPDDKEQVDKNK